MQVQGVIADVGAVEKLGPGLATVAASYQAAHLDGAVHVAGVGRVGGDADDTLAQRRHVGGDVGVDHAIGIHGFPVGASVLGAVHRAGLVSGEDGVGVVGVEGQGPDVALQRVQRLPMASAVVAAVGALMGAGKDDVGIVGVDQQRTHLGVFRQTVGNADPLVVALGAAVQAASADEIPFARQSDVDVGQMIGRSHVSPPH